MLGGKFRGRAQLIPAAIGAPFLALLDRHGPARVLAAGNTPGRGMGVTALAITADAPIALIYAGAGAVASTAFTISRPAQAVIVPRPAARSAEESEPTW